MTISRFQTQVNPDVTAGPTKNGHMKETHEELREESLMGFERRVRARGYLEPYEGSAEERYRNFR